MSARLRSTAFLALLAVATIMRIWLATTLHDQSFFGKYTFYAAQLQSGTLGRSQIGDVSPAYLLVVFVTRVLGAGPQEIWYAQILLLSIAVFACAAVARRLAGGVGAVAAAILLLANRSAYVNALEIEPETCILAFHAIGLWLALWALQLRRTAWVIAAGSLLSVPFIFRPVQILPFAAFTLAVLLGRRSDADTAPARHRWALLLPLIAVPLLLFAATRLFTSRNAPMNPGTVFYEGMNPVATGYPVQLPIVKELQQTVAGMDTVHVTYRLVAAAATGARPDDDRVANRFWFSKAVHFIRRMPLQAAQMELKKVVAVMTDYDAYDLAPSFLKSTELESPAWIGYGFLWPLAIAGMILRRNDWRMWCISAFTAGVVAPMLIFYVSARHRDPLVVGLAMLGGVAVEELWRRWRSGERRRVAVVFAGIVALAIPLHLRTNEASEDLHVWRGFLGSMRLERAAAQQGGLRRQQIEAIAWTHRPFSTPPVSEPLARWASVERLKRETEPAALFDLAVSLQRANAWDLAEQVLVRLAAIDYRPSRGGRLVNSIAWYRARGMLHLANPREAQHLASAALSEAAGDAYVLALDARLNGTEGSAVLIDSLYDPFTAAVARAQAAFDAGDRAGALRLVDRATAAFPGWPRAANLRDEIAKREAPRTD